MIYKEKSLNPDLMKLMQIRNTVKNESVFFLLLNLDCLVQLKHKECLQKLLELGAKVDVHDVAGQHILNISFTGMY